MILAGENFADTSDVSDAVIADALGRISPQGPGYFSLTASDGSYVQTAGARLMLTVEYRRITNDGFVHYVLGDSQRDDRAPRQINSSVGFINLFAHEILDVDSAIEVFCHFLRHQDVPTRFTLRDDSVRFFS